MSAIWNIITTFFVSPFKSRETLLLEILVLRQQLIVLQRKTPKRAKFKRTDRLIFAWLYRIRPEILASIQIVKPETIVRWHKKGFRLFWRWKSQHRGSGRPRIDKDLRALICQMCRENPLWGAPRIHGELLKLGFKIAQSIASKYVVRTRKPPSQTWKTFLGNHADEMAAIDFLVVPTVGFRLLYVFIVIGHTRRQFIHFAVTTNPTARWTARQIVEAFPWETAPQYLVRDNDSIFGLTFEKQLRTMNIEDVRTAPRSPWQNAHAERLIGSIRRECLDHIIILGERHLSRVLGSYADYYNKSRTHLSLEKDCPGHREILTGPGKITPIPQVGGLHHRYERLAA